MKKLSALFLLVPLLILTLLFPVSAQENEIEVFLDAVKIEFDVTPQVINGRTMVPIRAIFENMGAQVEWDSQTASAICTKDDTVVKMTVNSPDMYVNNQLIPMDISPVEINGRTLAPARYVAEAFGADVQWSAENNAVVICSKGVYAYADYPDIPDLGKCYDLPLFSEKVEDGFKVFTYVCDNQNLIENYDDVYEHSALILGNYIQTAFDVSDDLVAIAYTKPNEATPRYYVGVTDGENDSVILIVLIPIETITEPTTETVVTLYAPDGRTIDVFESEIPAYKEVGWYETLEETQQILYAPDGRTITVYQAEVPAYQNVGWYESYSEAVAANQPATSNNTYGQCYYRTPTGKRYHLSPTCGGKNSYKTTNITGLTPCAKCAR